MVDDAIEILEYLSDPSPKSKSGIAYVLHQRMDAHGAFSTQAAGHWLQRLDEERLYEKRVRLAVLGVAIEEYQARNGAYPGNLEALAPDILPEIPQGFLYEPVDQGYHLSAVLEKGVEKVRLKLTYTRRAVSQPLEPLLTYPQKQACLSGKAEEIEGEKVPSDLL
jgi:hypothetical protein